MSQRGGISDSAGFTLQEMIVVMIVGSLLVVFSYSLYLFVMGFYYQKVASREHREALHRAAVLLSTDIEKSRDAWVTDSSLILDRVTQRLVSYRVSNGKIERNGTFITLSDSSVWRLKARHMNSATDPGTITIEIMLHARWGHDSCETTIQARVPWSSKAAFITGKTSKQP